MKISGQNCDSKTDIRNKYDFDATGIKQVGITDKGKWTRQNVFWLESWSVGKARENRNSLSWWEKKSLLKENKVDVGAKKSNPIIGW